MADVRRRGQFYTAGAVALVILLLIHILTLPRVEYRPMEPGRARALRQMLESLTANALAYATRSSESSQYTSRASHFVSEALDRVDYRILRVESYRVEAGGGPGRAWARAEYVVEGNLYKVEASFAMSITGFRVYFSNYTLEYLADIRLYAEVDGRPCREVYVEETMLLDESLSVKSLTNLDNGTFIVVIGLGPMPPPEGSKLTLLVSDWRGVRVEVGVEV
ncbi:MAG: hypothetical protein DRJ67_10735 [Thermoprotei archaeon]|nr:MAG: hypothetical protein DRJ67_10735 [Thermoprotei archaeon]